MVEISKAICLPQTDILDDIKVSWWRSFSLMRLFPPYCRSSEDTVFGMSVYGRFYDKKWFKPFRLYHTYVLQNIDKVYWWIRYRTFSRYHIINTKEIGWRDVDYRMFLACFTLLGQFVEGELGIASVDEAIKYGQYRGYRLHCEGGTDEAAIDLWLWYRFELSQLREEQRNNYKKFVKKYGYDYIDELSDKKLKELMEIRTSLWT